ncbi:MAG: tRNA 4-thiouridine(8) synthase ThiI [Methanomicrobiales archaeon]|nr:tRNA 4-thiouridine(8) synthase ThiI [Methanomicrobiales archaeon]
MNVVLVKYGELFLKSESVRRWYITHLLDNLRMAFDAAGLAHSFDIHRGRILVQGPDTDALADIARSIFGIVGVSVCTRTAPDRAAIESAAVAFAAEHLQPGMSFGVRARRSGMEGFTSQELGASVGAAVLDAVPGVRVDLTSPDYELFVEARDFGGLVYDTVLPGPGGLPLGTQGRVLSLLSAGIDSPVAGWLMMRRGCRLVHLHCDGGSWAGSDVRSTAELHHRTLSTWCPGQPLLLIVADFEPFYERLAKEASVRNRCVICKRFMHRVAARIADMETAGALVTGDNLGQVASQTLANMGVIASVVPPRIPVLRPLITYDKDETVALARSIRTFRDHAGDLGCRAVPKHPAIAADMAKVENDETLMRLDELETAVYTTLRYYEAKNGVIREITGPESRFPRQSR